MVDGKKSTAEKIVYDALDILSERTNKEPVQALEDSIKTLTPVLEVRSRRVGGATYQVPVEVPARRARTLAVRWLVEFSRERREKTMAERLAGELATPSRSRAAPTSARTTSTAWRRPTRPSPITAGSPPIARDATAAAARAASGRDCAQPARPRRARTLMTEGVELRPARLGADRCGLRASRHRKWLRDVEGASSARRSSRGGLDVRLEGPRLDRVRVEGRTGTPAWRRARASLRIEAEASRSWLRPSSATRPRATPRRQGAVCPPSSRYRARPRRAVGRRLPPPARAGHDSSQRPMPAWRRRPRSAGRARRSAWSPAGHSSAHSSTARPKSDERDGGRPRAAAPAPSPSRRASRDQQERAAVALESAQLAAVRQRGVGVVMTSQELDATSTASRGRELGATGATAAAERSRHDADGERGCARKRPVETADRLLPSVGRFAGGPPARDLVPSRGAQPRAVRKSRRWRPLRHRALPGNQAHGPGRAFFLPATGNALRTKDHATHSLPR